MRNILLLQRVTLENMVLTKWHGVTPPTREEGQSKVYRWSGEHIQEGLF